MKRADSVHGLRQKVNARDKALIVTRPFDEGIKYLSEKYNTDKETAESFVSWLKGLYNPDGGAKAMNPVETWHTRFDEGRAEWVQVPESEAHKPKLES